MVVSITKEVINEVKRRIISLHDKCINGSGGTLGILSEGSLEFAIYDILRFSEKSKDGLLKAAYVYFIIATRHCFFDGNKRTAHLFAKQLLLDNNIHLMLHYQAACPFILKVANGEKTIEEIQAWLQKHTTAFSKSDREKYLKDILLEIEHTDAEMDVKNE